MLADTSDTPQHCGDTGSQYSMSAGINQINHLSTAMDNLQTGSPYIKTYFMDFTRQRPSTICIMDISYSEFIDAVRHNTCIHCFLLYKTYDIRGLYHSKYYLFSRFYREKKSIYDVTCITHTSLHHTIEQKKICQQVTCYTIPGYSCTCRKIKMIAMTIIHLICTCKLLKHHPGVEYILTITLQPIKHWSFRFLKHTKLSWTTVARK